MHSEVLSILEEISSAQAQILAPGEDEVGDSSILVQPESIYDVCLKLRDNEKYSFKALEVITGTDYKEYIEVSYVVGTFDMKNPATLILKTRLTDRENPVLKSVCDIWLAANYQERECFDMLGVRFEGHPDHRRILCPDDWEGFPLRKDYVVQDSYRGMTVNPPDKMNLEDQDFINQQDSMKDELIKRALAKGL